MKSIKNPDKLTNKKMLNLSQKLNDQDIQINKVQYQLQSMSLNIQSFENQMLDILRFHKTSHMKQTEIENFI